MKMIIERGTAIAEVLLSDRKTPHGYKHVIVRAQAPAAADAADLACDIANMLKNGRETWWRTRLETEQVNDFGRAFLRFSFADRPGEEREYDDTWREEHANVLGLGGLK